MFDGFGNSFKKLILLWVKRIFEMICPYTTKNAWWNIGLKVYSASKIDFFYTDSLISYFMELSKDVIHSVSYDHLIFKFSPDGLAFM